MIYNHSSIEMDEVKDGSIECVITSPPYPMIEKWDEVFNSQIDCDRNGSFLSSQWEESIYLICSVLSLCYDKLIDGGILCLNIGDATRSFRPSGDYCGDKMFMCFPNYARLVIECFNLGFYPLIPILWKKITNRPNSFLGSGFLPVNAYVSQDCEYIAIFRKGRNRKFSDEEKSKRNLSKFTKNERDLWFSQVWEINGKRGAGNTSSWPDEIFYRLMRMFSIKGDTILDPFCGKGNELMANENGRNYIGYEISIGG